MLHMKLYKILYYIISDGIFVFLIIHYTILDRIKFNTFLEKSCAVSYENFKYEEVMKIIVSITCE